MKRIFPPCDLARQAGPFRKELERACRKVIQSGRFVSGPEGKRFEHSFRRAVSSQWAVGTSSGTDALKLALIACGVKSGDEVITPAMTYVATAEAIIQAGARPVLVDIDPDTYCMNPDLVQAAMTRKTRVIVPVHLYGHPADMHALLKLARKYNVQVIEDAAQAHGAMIRGKKAGSFGRMACFSFFPTKNLGAYGDAGIVVGKRHIDMLTVRRLANHGGLKRDEHKFIGYANRLDELQAAFLNIKLTHLDAWNQKKHTLAKVYDKHLRDLPVGLPSEMPGTRHVYHQYVITCKSRDRVLSRLRKKGVGCLVHYPRALHQIPSLSFLRNRKRRFPVAERLAAQGISLPIYPELSVNDVKWISVQIHRVVNLV